MPKTYKIMYIAVMVKKLQYSMHFNPLNVCATLIGRNGVWRICPLWPVCTNRVVAIFDGLFSSLLTIQMLTIMVYNQVILTWDISDAPFLGIGTMPLSDHSF